MFPAYAQKSEPFQSVMTHNASCINDRRTLPVAQRVVQRESGIVQRVPSNGVFKFYPNISGSVYKDRVPYLAGKICFTPYTNGGILSAGFNGCYMMAFRFVEDAMKRDPNSYLLFDRSVPMSSNFSVTYIAHVSNDTTARDTLFDAENRGLVQIERIFRPYRSDVRDKPVLDSLSLSPDNRIVENSGSGSPRIQACINKFTGGMVKTAGGEWESYVFNQEKLFNEPPNLERTNFDWRIGNVIRYYLNAHFLENESIATKICLYASVAKHSENSETRNEASRKLNVWIRRYPELAQYAKNFHFSTTDTAKDLITI
jgi:hypothetical protein